MTEVWDIKKKCQVESMSAHLLLGKNVNDRAKFEWRVDKLLWFLYDLQSHCK